MDIGMPELIEVDSLTARVKLCAGLGLDFVELNMNIPSSQAGALRAGDLNALKKKYGIYFTVHLDENLNPFDFNRKVSEAYSDTLKDTVALAKEAEIPLLNMHLAEGVYFTMPDEKIYLYDRYENVYLDSVRAFRDDFDKEARDSGVTIAVENTNGYRAFQQKAIDILLESEVFALTYDIGHGACAGYADEKFITERRTRLKHFHVHDSANGKCHLPLGEGAADWRKYLAAAENLDCRAVIETKTVAGLEASVYVLRHPAAVSAHAGLQDMFCVTEIVAVFAFEKHYRRTAFPVVSDVNSVNQSDKRVFQAVHFYTAAASVQPLDFFRRA